MNLRRTVISVAAAAALVALPGAAMAGESGSSVCKSGHSYAAPKYAPPCPKPQKPAKPVKQETKTVTKTVNKTVTRTLHTL